MNNRRRQLADVLRAETAGQDLREGPHGIHVYAMQQDGKVYELGSVSAGLVLEDPDGARAAISRIKFGRLVGGAAPTGGEGRA